MSIPYDFERLASWSGDEIRQLPKGEDEWHEYKSGRTSFDELRTKVGVAASAFWNSGGGLFFAGLNNVGMPDTGIFPRVGRQDLIDWAHNCVALVSPASQYQVRLIEDPSFNFAENRVVLLIAFAESRSAPHMAPDHRYYIRAGTHSVPAKHFVVEALLARRGLHEPQLRCVLRRKRGLSHVIQLGIVTASATPALDVLIGLPPLRYFSEAPSVLSAAVITQEAPFYLDFHISGFGSSDDLSIPVQLSYSDLAGRRYESSSVVDFKRQLGRSYGSETNNTDLVSQLRAIEKSISGVSAQIKSNEQHLKAIASKK